MSAFSVCIPRVFNNIPNKKIISTFENLKLGKVKNMDIVWKTGRDGSSFKMVFIHFSEWNMNSSAAKTFRENVENPNVEAKLVYDDPWHWIVLPNKSQIVTDLYSNEPMKRNNMVYGINTWNERITNLEDELNCIYEELYQREYIPVKYRTMCDLDNDIETGNISTLNAYTTTNVSQYNSMSPQCMSPPCISPQCMSPLTMADLENYDDTELHTPPRSRANLIPYSESDSYNSSNYEQSEELEQVEVQIHDYSPDNDQDQYYEIKLDQSVDTFKNLISNKDKVWMTVNCCGNA